MGMRCRLRKQPGDDNLISSYVFIVTMSVIICVTCVTGHNPIIPVIVSGKSMESTLVMHLVQRKKLPHPELYLVHTVANRRIYGIS